MFFFLRIKKKRGSSKGGSYLLQKGPKKCKAPKQPNIFYLRDQPNIVAPKASNPRDPTAS
jgi:hypothetical protein